MSLSLTYIRALRAATCAAPVLVPFVMELLLFPLGSGRHRCCVCWNGEPIVEVSGMGLDAVWVGGQEGAMVEVGRVQVFV